MPIMAKERQKKTHSKSKQADDEHKYLLRLPYGTFQAIEQDAKRNFRTTNLHLLWLIERRLGELEREGE